MTKIPFPLAHDAAYMLRANLFDGVMRCELVGFLRIAESYLDSGADADIDEWEVGGIELLAIPNIGRVRHTRGSSNHNFLIERLNALGYPYEYTDEKVTFYAPTPSESIWIPVRLWLTALENFGYDYFLRTGTNAFVQSVCIPQSAGGWLKEGIKLGNGVWQGEQKVICLTEAQFFREAFGREVIAPHLRKEAI